MWPWTDDGEDHSYEEESYPVGDAYEEYEVIVSKRVYEELMRRYEQRVDERVLFGPCAVDLAYWFFPQEQVRPLASRPTHEMIIAAQLQAYEVMRDLEDEGDDRWLDWLGWGDGLQDTLLDIRSLPDGGVEPEVCMVLPTALHRRRRGDR